MAVASINVEFPRRQAMLSIREPHYKGNGVIEFEETARVPVFVCPMPTTEGLFVVEHQDGTVQSVQPRWLRWASAGGTGWQATHRFSSSSATT